MATLFIKREMEYECRIGRIFHHYRRQEVEQHEEQGECIQF